MERENLWEYFPENCHIWRYSENKGSRVQNPAYDRKKKSSLSKVGADLKIYFHTKEDYWKQKVGMKWFSDEESNLKFFHAYVKGKRGKLQVKEI